VASGDGVGGHRAGGGAQHPNEGHRRDGLARHEASGAPAENQRLDWLPQLAVIGDVKAVGRGGSAAATGFAGACAPPVVPGFGGIEVRAVQVAQGVVDRVDG
jgi:hypothetical protein